MPNHNLQLPDGWTRSNTRVTLTVDSGTYYERLPGLLVALRDWADQAGYRLNPYDYQQVLWTEWAALYPWAVFELIEDDSPDNQQVIGEHTCTDAHCGGAVQAGACFCPENHLQMCANCQLVGLRLHALEGYPGRAYCAGCLRRCSSPACGNTLPIGSSFDQCVTCDPRFSCAHCAGEFPEAQQHSFLVSGTNETELTLCESCLRHGCDGCHRFPRATALVNAGGHQRRLCADCQASLTDADRESCEAWPSEEIPVSGSLLIPSTSSRPVRMISIETEFDGNGTAVGRALYRAGLLRGAEVGNYSHQGHRNTGFPCILKRDGTVTGGELVTALMQLDNDQHAAAVQRMTEVMRGCREVGLAEFSHRAGGHIHIDLHGFTMQDLWAYYTLFKYLEMPIYYLAGAGAEYGHRSKRGSSYCAPPPYGPFGTLNQFALGHSGGGRYGLHLGNYRAAISNCNCGAMAAMRLEDCECDLGKATAEWRVFNAEIQPRILHAWLALVQALTAYAHDLEGFEESNFPYLNWTTADAASIANSVQDELRQRFEWMFSNLPLTTHERDSLVYTCRQSELRHFDWVNELHELEPTQNIDKKPARNPGRRTRDLVVLTEAAAAARNNNAAFFTNEEGYCDPFDNDEANYNTPEFNEEF